jgi:hypothetical protein
VRHPTTRTRNPLEYDALTGWDDDTTAETYAAFTRAYPMYSASSRDLAARAGLTRSRVIVDLRGGTGTTAEAILALAPPSSPSTAPPPCRASAADC